MKSEVILIFSLAVLYISTELCICLAL